MARNYIGAIFVCLTVLAIIASATGAVETSRTLLQDTLSAASVSVLDLTSIDPTLIGFKNGFSDGIYGYMIPHTIAVNSPSAKIVRFSLAGFNSYTVLDLGQLSNAGFSGGFTVGSFGYILPKPGNGNIVRFSITDFSSFTVLNLRKVDASLHCCYSGFTDGTYGYTVPYGKAASTCVGKIVRFPLTFDTDTADVLNLHSVDPTLSGFFGGFSDGTYGYAIPSINGFNGVAFYHSKVVRFLLADFSTLSILNLTDIDPTLDGFNSGFTDGTYGYLAPKHLNGKVPRFALDDFRTVSVLDLIETSTYLHSFEGAFMDGTYGYLVPNINGKMVRFSLQDFSSISVLDVNQRSPLLGGFSGGFSDGSFGYLVPFNFAGARRGSVVRFTVAKSNTCGGTGQSAACNFPFMNDGVQYEACTTKGHDQLWCKLGASDDWGNCDCEECWAAVIPQCSGQYHLLGDPITDLNTDWNVDINDCKYAMLINPACIGSTILYNAQGKCLCSTSTCSSSHTRCVDCTDIDQGLYSFFKRDCSPTIAETSVTTLTSITTSSAIAPHLLLGFSMLLKVSDVEQFDREPRQLEVLKDCVLQMSSVPSSWISNISTIYIYRSTSSERDVKVQWSLQFPSNQMMEVVRKRFEELTILDATATVREVFKRSGFAYEVDVIQKNYDGQPQGDEGDGIIPEQGNGRGGSTEIVLLIIIPLVVVVLLLFLVALKIIYRKRRKVDLSVEGNRSAELRTYFEQTAGPLACCGLLEMMNPPEAISTEQGDHVRKLARAILRYEPHDAPVFVTYALGKRPSDADGCGPGMYFAAAVLKMLFENDVKCICDLMLPAGSHDLLIELLGSQFASVKVLLVLQTKALYNSQDVLIDIFTAQSAAVEVIPLRFENDLPSASEVWPQVARDDISGVMMLSAVKERLGKCKGKPAPPYTVIDEPCVLDDLLTDLKRRYVSKSSNIRTFRSYVSSFSKLPASLVGLSSRKRQLKNAAREESSHSLRSQSSNEEGSLLKLNSNLGSNSGSHVVDVEGSWSKTDANLLRSSEGQVLHEEGSWSKSSSQPPLNLGSHVLHEGPFAKASSESSKQVFLPDECIGVKKNDRSTPFQKAGSNQFQGAYSSRSSPSASDHRNSKESVDADMSTPTSHPQRLHSSGSSSAATTPTSTPTSALSKQGKRTSNRVTIASQASEYDFVPRSSRHSTTSRHSTSTGSGTRSTKRRTKVGRKSKDQTPTA